MFAKVKASFINYIRFCPLGSVFIVFFIIALIIYAGGYKGELVDDGLAGLVTFEDLGWHGFWQSFGFSSLYYFHDLAVLIVYKLVGKSAFGWFVVMVSLHSLNASLSFIMFKKFYSLMGVTKGALIAFTGCLLFLLSPYQTENVLWAATMHYSVALAIFLVSCIILLEALEHGQLSAKTTGIIAIIFCIALMTLEISLVFPFAYCLLAGVVIYAKKTRVNTKQFLAGFALPMLCIIPVYFMATRIIKGHWLPHYGETHLLNNNLQTYSTNYARYVLKLLAYAHYTTYPARDAIYTFCQKWKLVLSIELLASSAVMLLFYIQGKKAEAIAFAGILLLSLILLVPSLHMYFMYLFNTENDRLGYYFSLGLYQLLALVLIGFFSYTGVIFICIYGVIGIYFLLQQTAKWQVAGTIQDKCIRSFTWTDATKVYVLNETTYYKGVYVFRADERLLFALDFFKKYKANGRVVQIFSTCTNSAGDSTLVEIKNDSTLHVKAVTSGWLMRESFGATDYGTDDFYTKIDKGAPGYEVIFHHKKTGDVYLYLTPTGFRQLENF